STPSAGAGTPKPSPLSHGVNVAVSEAKANPNAAVSETTEGARYRHKPGSHDPFIPLPLPKTASTAVVKSNTSSVSSPSTGSSSTSVEKSSSGSTNTGGSSTTPSTPVKKPAPKKATPKPPTYAVSAQYGVLSTTPGQLAQLTPYPDLKRLQQLPSAQDVRLVFSGARGNGKGAVFALSREAILKGPATCIPSAEQCEAIDLEAGQSEELAYLEPDGQSVPYELKVLTITKESSTASAASVHHHRHHHHHHR
ncbi:MAG: hypothetical protein ABSH36_12125, partial [Solirubrobacteraceae bacterium]